MPLLSAEEAPSSEQEEEEEEAPPAADDAPRFEPGQLWLAVLQASVPALCAAVEAQVAAAFHPSRLADCRLPPTPDRTRDALPARVGRELLNWGRRCGLEVAVPAAWLAPGGAFVPGAPHRREVLTALCRAWAAQAELAAAELQAARPAPPPPAPPTPLWVVDVRRLRNAEQALRGAIPLVSLDGSMQAEVPEAQAAALRARSPRLADALRIAHACHEHWRGRDARALAAGEEGALLEAERRAFCDSPGGLDCRCCVYYLDTWSAAPHRPGAMASQAYVGLVGVREHANGGALHNSLRRRAEQHRAGGELLADLELRNPALTAPGLLAGGATCAPPGALLLALDWGVPGLAAEEGVGWLESRYMRYFDCTGPLGLNCGATAPHGLARGELDPGPRGSSCHWCRQKTDSCKVKCAFCPVAFCQPCLLLRHGLSAAAAGARWRCPKCCGTCNCSVCRRRAGLAPTGQLAAAALAAGYSGVEAYLAATEQQPSAKRQATQGEARRAEAEAAE